MPLYEFRCEACDHDFEQLFSSMNSPAKVPCPKCGSKKTRRKLSLFGFASKDGRGRTRSSASSCASCRATSCAGCRK